MEAHTDHYAFKSRLPLIVRYDLPERFNNTDICFSGMVFINEVKYFHEDKRCIKLPNQKTILYGFDMGKLPILSISIDSNDITSLWINILKYLKIVSAFSILVLLGKVNRSFIIITFVGTISIFIFLADYTLQNGLRSGFSTFVYMSRGNDGLVHFAYGRQILENFIEGNYLLAIRGGVDIFLLYAWGKICTYNLDARIRGFFFRLYSFGVNVAHCNLQSIIKICVKQISFFCWF